MKTLLSFVYAAGNVITRMSLISSICIVKLIVNLTLSSSS